METIKVSTSQHVDIDYPVAGLGERIAARLIDLAIFFGLYIVFILLGLLLDFGGGGGVFFYVLIIIYISSFVFYSLLCEIFMDGQSVGKKLMKIKVISIDGSQAGIGQYFIRWLFRLVDFWLTAHVAAIICIAVSDKKQRIGDMVAGTTLIKTVQHTTFEHIAFQPTEEDYIPVFRNVDQLNDRNIELIHEVIGTYYKTHHHELIYSMAGKVSALLAITIPEGMNELDFLKTVIKDYNHLTSFAE